MNRRGVAMIMVLGASVVLLSLAAIIARTRATDSLRRSSDESLVMAWAVCDAAEPAITRWLERESRSVVLDNDSPAPVVSVMSSSLDIGGIPVEVTVTAWDQCGMWPRLTSLQFPENAQRFVESRHPGLDLVVGSETTFPSIDHPARFGGLYATHNPLTNSEAASRDRAVPRLNVNTAPAEILQWAYAELGRGDLDSLLQRRSSGELTSVPAARSNRDGRIVLTGTSTAWGIRTDVTCGGVEVSVWSVYIMRGGSWIREQHLVIAD